MTLLPENLYITGSVDALENWSVDDALILSAADYPTWSSASPFLFFGSATMLKIRSHRRPSREHNDPVQVSHQVQRRRHLGRRSEQRDYDALADLLQHFEGRHSHVPDWNVGGEIYKAFLQLVGYERRREQPPAVLVNSLLEGLPAMHGNTPEAGIVEYAALTDMASEVAKAVASMAKAGQVRAPSPTYLRRKHMTRGANDDQMEHERILQLPLTEDVLLKHSRDLAWSHYTSVMAGY